MPQYVPFDIPTSPNGSPSPFDAKERHAALESIALACTCFTRAGLHNDSKRFHDLAKTVWDDDEVERACWEREGDVPAREEGVGEEEGREREREGRERDKRMAVEYLQAADKAAWTLRGKLPLEGWRMWSKEYDAWKGEWEERGEKL